jgi:site-specific DNA-methyltransferase (adenine-specific)
MNERNGGAVRSLPLKRNAPNKIDGRFLLGGLDRDTVALAFLDPQYRGVLDKLKFGNEGKRQTRRTALPQMDDATIDNFVCGIARALRPSGHMVLWADKYSIASGKHLRWMRNAGWLRLVDMIAWNTTVMKMGKRTRGITEYAIVLQKEPKRAKGFWQNRAVGDSWTEEVDKTRHPHAKPHRLTLEFIRNTTKRGDLVVDPCAGSYGVLAACQEMGREFLGGDLI